MIMISVKEAALLKGCSEQFLRKLALNRQIHTVTERTKNGRMKYMIPLTELTEPEQIRYYQQNGLDVPEELQKTTAKIKNKVQRSTDIESYSADQREEISVWQAVLREWEEYCMDKPSKTQATKDFAAAAQAKHPEIRISSDVLYRKKRALKEHGVCGLIDLRGGHNKGSSMIPAVVWNTYLSFYLDLRKFPESKCYEWTQQVMEENCPELLPLPSYNTFTRHIRDDLTLALKTLGRDGEKAFHDRCQPYIKRIYDNLCSNDIWFGDNHTLDIESLDKNGRLHRLHMSTFMDARSGVITAFYLSDANTGQTTLISLRKGIIGFGCPITLYLDNGREYMVTDIAGLGHRQKQSTADRENPPTVLQRLNVGLINALVRNAQAKNIERSFRDVKDHFSRLFDTFVGGNILEKPESLKLVLKGKQGHIPTDEEVTEAIESYISGVFNLAPYNGRVAKDKGKPKLQVFEENLQVKVVIPEEDLNLMLMRSSRMQTVGRRGVHLNDVDYWNDELLAKYSGKKVYFRYDPENLSSIRLYDTDDRYLMTVPADNVAVREFGSGQEELKEALKKVRSFAKASKEALQAQTATLFDKKSALELMLQKAESNKKQIQISQGSYLIDIRQADEKEHLEKAVGADSDNLVSFERMIRNIESRYNDE